MSWRRAGDKSELAVLGAVFTAASNNSQKGLTELGKVTAAGLREEHFGDPRAGACFRAMLQAAKRHEIVDVTTVLTEVERAGDGELVSGDWQFELVSTHANIQGAQYARIVIEHAERRSLYDAAREAAERIENGEDESAEHERSKLASKLSAQGGHSARGLSNRAVVTSAVEGFIERARQTRPPGTPLGIRSLTSSSGGGAQKKRVYTIGARPGVGKSAMGLQLMNYSAVDLGVPWQFHTLEMDPEECIGRMVAQRGRVNANRWSGSGLIESDAQRIFAAAETIAADKVSISWHQNTNADVILSRIEAWAHDPRTLASLERANEARGGTGLVPVAMIDHLHYATGQAKGEGYLDFLARFTKRAKQVAKRGNVAIVFLAQLNRSSANEKREPTQADLRGAGAIEENSDAIILLHRLPNGETPDEATAIVDKMRNGQTGKYSLRWDGQHQRFEEA
jgi:replicative DNA helicase